MPANIDEFGSGKARALLVEDHPSLQEIVTTILSAEFNVVGVLGRGNDVLPAAQDLYPDVVILDVSLPDISGMQILVWSNYSCCAGIIFQQATKSFPTHDQPRVA